VSPRPPAVLSIHVVGVPSTQGSMRGYVVGGRARITSTNASRLKPWREAVRATAVSTIAVDHLGPWQPLTGPVGVRIVFALPKPASAPKTRRTWPVGARSGDVDKLARACLDACTDAGVWRDDSQVVDLHAVKDYPGPDVALTVPGALITVWRAS
jgi:crossover junction endodeoxyribonuclease RusA